MHPAYRAGDPLYWRVAAVDEGRNTGDWSPVQQIGLVKRLRLVARGAPKRRQVRTIATSVLSASNRPIAGATVRVSGGGVRRAAARTNRRGIAKFRLRPTRRGFITFRATKSGYEAGALRLRIR
jgi:hypothetical protein